MPLNSIHYWGSELRLVLISFHNVGLWLMKIFALKSATLLVLWTRTSSLNLIATMWVICSLSDTLISHGLSFFTPHNRHTSDAVTVTLSCVLRHNDVRWKLITFFQISLIVSTLTIIQFSTKYTNKISRVNFPIVLSLSGPFCSLWRWLFPFMQAFQL